MSDAIAIRGVTKTFGTKVAVSDLDLTVPQGSLYGFIGPNGAGKSTTIRMVMSIFFPDRGEISVLGKKSAIESKDRIGYLPEERGLYRKMRVGALLTFMGRLKGVPEADLRKRVRTWLERVGLAANVRSRCEELSKGMQQKIQFIAAVLHEPDLIILDEPFSGLDPVNRKLLRELIDEQHRAGRTIIFSTHAMYEAEQLCDRILMINGGKKVLDLSMAELWRRHDPRTVVVERLEAGPSELERGWKEIPGVESVRDVETGVELKLREGADPAVVLRAAAELTRARRVELKRLTLEEIFIDMLERTVGSGEQIEQIKAEIEQERARAGAEVV